MKNHTANHDSRLWELLTKERLVDLSQFHEPGLCEEVPLVSRAADLAFLAHLSADDASVILLRFALKFLKAVVSFEEHQTPFLAAITAWECPTDEPVIPQIFVWSKPSRKGTDRLALEQARTPFGERMKRLVARLDLPGRFDVLEDRTTAPEMSRVFVGPAVRAYSSFVPVRAFCIRSVAGRGKRPSKAGSK